MLHDGKNDDTSMSPLDSRAKRLKHLISISGISMTVFKKENFPKFLETEGCFRSQTNKTIKFYPWSNEKN